MSTSGVQIRILRPTIAVRLQGQGPKGNTGDPAGLSDATPQPLGTATPGTEDTASRSGHVHAMPSASDVGATPSSHASLTTTAHGGVVASNDSRLGLAESAVQPGDLGTAAAEDVEAFEAADTDIQAHIKGTGSPHTAAGVGAYRAQAVAASANVSGAVTPSFTSLLLQYTLTGNLTSFGEPTNLADGETGAIWITLGAYGMFAKPAKTATAQWGPWTVTGPIVRVGVQRLGTVYYWTAVSF